MEIILSPSILAADFGNLAREVEKAERGGAQWVHLDVMDGHFVPNISFGIPVVAGLRRHTKLFFDVHLMIENTERYIEPFVKAGADLLTVHYESVKDLSGCIDLIHSFGKKAGIAVNPDTPVSVLEPYLNKVELVLVMSVYPGYGGQKYIMDADEKLRTLRQRLGPDFPIQVDGGINRENIRRVVSCGANVIVAGTAVFNEDTEGSARGLLEAVR